MGKIFYAIIFILLSNSAQSNIIEDSILISNTSQNDTVHEKGCFFNVAALALIDFSDKHNEQFGIGFYRNIGKSLSFSSTLSFMIKRAETNYFQKEFINDTFTVQKLEYFTKSQFCTFQSGLTLFNQKSKFTIYTGIDVFYSFYKDIKTTNEKYVISPSNLSNYPFTVVDEITVEKSFRRNHVIGLCIKLGMTAKLNDKLRISFGIEPYFGKSYTTSRNESYSAIIPTFSNTTSGFTFLPRLFNNLSLIIKLNK